MKIEVTEYIALEPADNEEQDGSDQQCLGACKDGSNNVKVKSYKEKKKMYVSQLGYPITG